MFESWSPNESTVYVRNDSYYDPSRPLLDSIVFRPIPDPQVAITNLTAGEVDLVSNQLILPQTAQSLEGQEGVQLVVVDPSTPARLHQHRLARGTARRQAGASGAGPLPRPERGQGARLRRHRHADQQLHGAGDLGLHRTAELRVRPGKGEGALRRGRVSRMGSRSTIDTIEGYPDLNATASIWQDGLKQAGVNADDRRSTRSTPGSIAGSTATISSRPTSTSMARTRSGCSSPTISCISSSEEWADQDAGDNRSRSWPAAAIATVDQEERKKIYADLQELLHDELPVIPMYHPAMIAAASTRLQGFRHRRQGLLPLRDRDDR